MPRGGARPGAGRPKKVRPPSPLDGIADPLEFLRAVMLDPAQTVARRVRAAIALLPYMHVKPVAGKTPEPAKAPGRSKYTALPAPGNVVPLKH